jgi:hypothetical protein
MRRSVLTSAMVIAFLFSLSAHAATYGGGTGDPNDPYQIWTPEQMNTIGANSADWGKCFILMADIDMSAYTGTAYNIIGNSTTNFTGTFDGNGYAISNLTYTTTTAVNYVGLFGYTNSATVRNLGIVNANISTGGSYAGGLVGFQSSGAITNCYSTGTISSSSTSSSANAGGLVGFQSNGNITTCYSTGTVSCSSTSSASAGGLVGSGGTITNCYSTASVNSSATSITSISYAGGIVGLGTITNCYSTGAVTASGSGTTYIGGLVGRGGGVNSFWDTQTSGVAASAGGTGRTTAQMKQAANYIGWNSPTQTNWTIDDGNDYPRLAWQNQTGTPLSAETLADYVPGAGTEAEPYLISTPEQLNIIGIFPDEWAKFFRLENDIDLSAFTGTQFNRIGVSSDKPFSGTFEGNGNIISNLTYTTTAAVSNAGLFSRINGATIRNLGVLNANISTGGFGNIAGGLVGSLYNGTITNCYSTGTVAASYIAGGLVGQLWSGTITITNCYSTCSVSASDSAGGLVGDVSQDGTITITNCYSTGAVTAYSPSMPVNAGGLAGRLGSSGTKIITNCYSTGAVTASSPSAPAYAGGLVGWQCVGAIKNCYSTGAVTASSPSAPAYAGGLVGQQIYYTNTIPSIEKCYSTGKVTATGNSVCKGGFIGYASSTITACFWDKDTSGLTIGIGRSGGVPSSGVIGKTTAEMKTLSTFTSAGWDFTNETVKGTADIWRMCANGVDYPRLSWQLGSLGDFACPDGVGMEDLLAMTTAWLGVRGQAGYSYACDANADGKINMMDFAFLAANWME